MRHQRGRARRSGRQQSKRKEGRRATTTGQEAPPPSSRHGTGIYFPTSLQHTAHFSHACRLPGREARLAAAQQPTYTGRAGPLRRRADRTGPAQTGPRAPPGPRSPGCLQTAPGARQPRMPGTLRPFPTDLGSKANSARTAPAASAGEGSLRRQGSAPIGCVPGGRAQRAASRPIGRRGRPARAGSTRPPGPPPPRATHGHPWRARKEAPL